MKKIRFASFKILTALSPSLPTKTTVITCNKSNKPKRKKWPSAAMKQKIVKLKFGLKQQKKPISSLSRKPASLKNGLNRGLIQKPTKISISSSHHYYSLMLRVFDGFQSGCLRVFFEKFSGNGAILVAMTIQWKVVEFCLCFRIRLNCSSLLNGLSLDVNHVIIDF